MKSTITWIVVLVIAAACLLWSGSSHQSRQTEDVVRGKPVASEPSLPEVLTLHREPMACVIQVLNGGLPLPEASIQVEGAGMPPLMTDQRGQCKVAVSGDRVLLRVSHESFGLVFWVASLSSDGVIVSYDQQEVVRCRILLDGERLHRKFALKAVISHVDGSIQTLPFSSDVGGLFSFGGTSLESNVTLFSCEREVVCDVPQSGGVLDLGFQVELGELRDLNMYTQKFLSGKLFDCGSGRFMDGTRVDLMLTYGGSLGGRLTFKGKTDEVGDFRILVRKGPILSVTPLVPKFDVISRLFSKGQLEDGQLGTVEVTGSRKVVFLLTGEAGERISSKASFYRETEPLESNISAINGEYVVQCPLQTFNGIVVVDGYQPTRFSVEKNIGERVEVEMTKAGPYLIRLVSEETISLEGFFVTLSNEEGLFEGADLPPLESLILEGELDGVSVSKSTGRISSISLLTSESGIIKLHGLKDPGSVLLQVGNAIGPPFFSEHLPQNTSSDTKEIQVQVESSGAIFGGVVMDESELPVAGATVSIKCDGEYLATMTDSSGRFRFSAVGAKSLRVGVAHDSFAPLVVHDVQVNGRTDTVYKLQRAVEASIVLALPCGAPVYVKDVWFENEEGRKFHSVTDTSRPGKYDIGGCIEGQYTAGFVFGGDAFSRLVYLSSGTSPIKWIVEDLPCLEVSGLESLELPVGGKVRVSWESNGFVERSFRISLDGASHSSISLHLPTFRGEGVVAIHVMGLGERRYSQVYSRSLLVLEDSKVDLGDSSE